MAVSTHLLFLVLLLFLVHTGAFRKFHLISCFDDDLQKCKTSSNNETVQVEGLGWRCSYVENIHWMCQSVSGVAIVLAEKAITCDRLSVVGLYMPGVKIIFDSFGDSDSYDQFVISDEDSSGDPLPEPRCYVWLRPEVQELLDATKKGEGFWRYLLDIRLNGTSFWWSRLEMKGLAATAAVADSAWIELLDHVTLKELVITDAHLGDTLHLQAQSMSLLTELRVERCHLREISSAEPLEHLHRLRLSGNRLRTLPLKDLGVTSLMDDVDASDNSELIVTSSDFAELNVSALNLSGVRSVGELLRREPLPPNKHLKTLTLDRCGIRKFAKRSSPFAQLPRLQNLIMRQNGLTEWPRDRDAYNNPVRRPNPVLRIDLSSNSLVHIPSTPLTAVEVLAADNQISSWAPDAFALPHNAEHFLTKLDLRRNHVRAIFGDMLQAVKTASGLERLLLHGNPLTCNACPVAPFAHWLNSSDHHLHRDHLQNLSCFEPPEKGGVRRLLLQVNASCFIWVFHTLLPVCACAIFVASVVFACLLLRKQKLKDMWKGNAAHPIPDSLLPLTTLH